MKQNEQILMLDVDWMPKPWWRTWLQTREAILNSLGYKLLRAIRKPSPGGRGLHVWFYVEGPEMDDMKKVKLQYLVGDCIVRSKINYRRVRRGIRGFWNKLFYIKHHFIPLPRRCRKCRIRLGVAELETKDEVWDEQKLEETKQDLKALHEYV